MTENRGISQEGDSLLLHGNVGFDTVAGLSRQLENILSDEIKTVDCSGITHADSAAISLLVFCLSLAKNRTIPLKIRGVSPALRSLVDLYGIEVFFNYE